MYKFYLYNDSVARVVITKNDKNLEKKEHSYSSTEYSEICSLSRSKRMIREYALCNDFKYFLTCTVNSQLCDRFSLSATQEKMRKIMKSIKRKNSDFKYLFITERHKDGAFHFHGLCTDLELYKNEYGYYSSLDFDKLGFNSFSKINDNIKCANYITKYISKECVKNESGSVYFCSKGLKKSVSYEIAPLDLDNYLTSFIPFENDYLKIFDIRFDLLTREELLYLSKNIKEKEGFLNNLLNNVFKGGI